MEIEVYKYNQSTGEEETEFLRIKNFRIMYEPKSLLFVKEGKITIDKDQSEDLFEIFKIQFIASCQTRFGDEILVAFYFSDESELSGYVLSELPSHYYTYKGRIIDYKSYIEICEITGETKLSLIEYYNYIVSANIGMNTLIKDKNGNYLNHDEQQKQQ